MSNLVSHFISVGNGNMALVILPNSTTMLFDCNVTTDNQWDVLSYLGSVLPSNRIDYFINTHRDADHMRGVADIHKKYPIAKVWDSGETGTSPYEPSYLSYMNLRRNVTYKTVEAGYYWTFGDTVVRCMNSGRLDTTDPNSQSMVFKIEYGSSSLLLTGDSDAVAWKNYVIPFYKDRVSSRIMLVSHHGALSFFDDSSDKNYYYTEHIKKIAPDICIVSTGKNAFGHPDPKALEFYEKYAKGSNQGNKIFRTDLRGNIVVTQRFDGSWSLT